MIETWEHLRLWFRRALRVDRIERALPSQTLPKYFKQEEGQPALTPLRSFVHGLSLVVVSL